MNDLREMFHLNDEFIPGPLTGVRFWAYSLNNMQITSFQWDHVWSPAAPTVDNEAAPTMENGRGLNVYKTVADALRGSADAVNDIVEQPARWLASRCGIVLGEVEFWGVTVEYEYGYAAQVVRPIKFLRAWGAGENSVVDELNVLWFGGKHGRNR
jgi:hypothetical protein